MNFKLLHKNLILVYGISIASCNSNLSAVPKKLESLPMKQIDVQLRHDTAPLMELCNVWIQTKKTLSKIQEIQKSQANQEDSQKTIVPDGQDQQDSNPIQNDNFVTLKKDLLDSVQKYLINLHMLQNWLIILVQESLGKEVVEKSVFTHFLKTPITEADKFFENTIQNMKQLEELTQVVLTLSENIIASLSKATMTAFFKAHAKSYTPRELQEIIELRKNLKAPSNKK